MTTGGDTLAAFLRSRRDRLTPSRAGIDPWPGARRVPGLRKEEVAWLAGLSTDHYSRIEQGRQRHLSPQVRTAIARALRLDEVEAAHFGALADAAAAPGGARRSPVEAQRADPGMLRLMTALGHVPVLLLGHRGEVLARNALLAAVLDAPLPVGTSFPRWLLTDPRAREVIVNWEDFAEAAVGGLRLELGRRPHDDRLRETVEELRAGDPDVARWWDDHAVSDRTSLVKHVRHEVAGPMQFEIETVAGPHDPDQRLVVYTVQPGSATARALGLLAGWSGSQPAAGQAPVRTTAAGRPPSARPRRWPG
ncbi:helix-turn-helix transcriptional regulator [Nocardioides flavescens]|uniref:Helix-turn-helix domain-containing protein n=1 Tax=Nocardioides flavescens TaxID=2691959 RepID=A0A6L7F1E7_9ACTN|nr:helix-turn-helix transcriptional regulator [Nocardioides flavescens]MXG91215.1 helix-turn-helix domain-containing protein [Nocardioides flavescens]